ncbi:hypothetical protein ES708_21504 [subsurface metagenome]
MRRDGRYVRRKNVSFCCRKLTFSFPYINVNHFFSIGTKSQTGHFNVVIKIETESSANRKLNKNKKRIKRIKFALSEQLLFQ